MVKNISYKLSTKDKNIQIDFKKLIFKGETFTAVSRIYNKVNIDDYDDILYRERQRQKQKEFQKTFAGFIEIWKYFTDKNVARDTVVWLVKDSINFCPKFVDLLYMVGFTLSILLTKVGIPLVILWLLTGGIALPIYLIFLVFMEHFIFTDVQIWYYTRYFYKYKEYIR